MRQSVFKPVFLVGLILALALSGVIASTVTAQEEEPGNGLRISPVRQELILAQGQEEQYEIEITNVSGGPLTVVSVINDFESDGESGQPRILTGANESSPFSLSNFVTLPDQFALDSGESETVTIDVSVPQDIAPGGYFGVVRFASGPDDDAQNIVLSASVGSLLLVNVPGDVQEGMELNFIEPRTDGEGGRFFESSPDAIAVSLENTGNSILKPFGKITVKNMFGSEVFTYEFNDDDQIRANVLPKSSRVFEDSVSSLGRIGRYTIESTISYGEGGGNIITASTTFWIVPWRILAVAIIGIGFIGWASTSGLKMYNRRVVERSKKNS